jgi:hypothetical protein
MLAAADFVLAEIIAIRGMQPQQWQPWGEGTGAVGSGRLNGADSGKHYA